MSGTNRSPKSAKTTGFLTDATLCIGCKACEVACKEWNEVPDDGFVWSGLSYDNTLGLGASTWRHVQFVEHTPEVGCGGSGRGVPESEPGGGPTWEFSSDVCKHCEEAGCLEACPTGSIVRTEMGGVFIQPDICNGCGYCVVACPFGVVDRRQGDDGRAWKCTFCYDRQKAGMKPACAKACPTESILFGELDALRETAAERVEELRRAGVDDAQVYDPESVGGIHALFLLRGDPRSFNLPDAPEAPTRHTLGRAVRSATAAATALMAATAVAFLAGGRSS